MSYDYLVLRTRRPIVHPNELDESDVVSLGTGEAVRRAITACFPDCEWHAWGGHVTRDGTWMEFKVASDEPTLAMFHIGTSHGADRASADRLVASFCRSLGAIAFDGQRAALLELGDAT